MGTVVVGLGNPILTDDGVGIKVAAAVRELLAGTGVEVVEAYSGGLRLMEAISGYRRAVIVDAMTGGLPPGTVLRIGALDGRGTRNLHSSHDGDLAGALRLGRELGLNLPELVELVGVEAGDVETFGEELSEAVRAALPQAVAAVMAAAAPGMDPGGLGDAATAGGAGERS
ncbi:peptidase M52 [Geoanaerobacter pelophilus]|uniref:Peptidase M52 n=1 Tax=Geoanaerobacter pelophilus TaxID=60036 RepID=A0ABQ0MLV1_9BACT|nr:hydrogenase maturation protease [Geoanaerobacter pelophilus]GAW67767.1 peptidase M52 [Geoanaerobacter pelophilus]